MVNLDKDKNQKFLLIDVGCKYTVLIIDDFGLQGKVPSVVKSTVYNFIDFRWKKKSTVFTQST